MSSGPIDSELKFVKVLPFTAPLKDAHHFAVLVLHGGLRGCEQDGVASVTYPAYGHQRT